VGRVSSIALSLFVVFGGVAAAQWRLPRTLDGHPDLEGVWDFATMTPLQRQARFSGREFMTYEEAVAFGREAMANVEVQRQAGLGGGAVNEFWFERGPLASIDGRWPTSLIVDPSDGRLPALTPAAQQRATERSTAGRRFDGPADLSLSERCLRSAAGPPYLAGAPDANLIRITQSRDHVAIVQEKFHETRIIPLDGRRHVSPAIRSWVGDSRGMWERDTLVVETRNFTPALSLGPRFDEHLLLVERFTRTADDALLYAFTVDDPTFFVQPWHVRLPMRRTRSHLHEFACHEGNYSLPNILRGARYQEQ
jgi:hypothetical protein